MNSERTIIATNEVCLCYGPVRLKKEYRSFIRVEVVRGVYFRLKQIVSKKLKVANKDFKKRQGESDQEIIAV